MTKAENAAPAGMSFRRRAGLDSHVLATLLFRGWNIIAGAIMIFLVPIWFTGPEQGYYYTFSSLLALQVFFELGLNQVVVQFVSHEAAHLSSRDDGTLSGPQPSLDRLTSLVHMLRHWYLIAALLFLLLVGVLGAWFFWRTGELPASHWIGPWILLTVGSALNLYLSPLLAILEGAGRVDRVARLRLFQSMVGYVLAWAALTLGAGLWAASLIPFAAAAITAYQAAGKNSLPRWLLLRETGISAAKMSWRREIFPFQWRIAVSWISGYFIFQLFLPLTFSNQGAVAAGQLGIGISIFNALLSVGFSWISAKIPVMASLIARNEREELNQVFMAVSTRSTLFAISVTLLTLAVVAGLGWFDTPVSARIPTEHTLALLGLAMVSNTVISAMAVYIRCHKEEPLLLQSAVVALTAAALLSAGSQHGVNWMLAGYNAVILLMSLPWVAIIFRRYYVGAAGHPRAAAPGH